MSTYIALAVVDDELAAMQLADALERLQPNAVGAFEIEDGAERWEVCAYFAEQPDPVALALLSAAFGGEIVTSLAPERDWAAHVRRQLTPVAAGRFVVHGAHDRDQISANQLTIEIEAAMAFGTGHHGSTEGCLLALDWLSRRGWRPRRIADIGCGTAVLAMAAAKQWPARVWASDIDANAVAAAHENIRANRVRHRVAAFQAAGLRNQRIRNAAPVDLLLANILARPLKRLAPAIAKLAAPGGVVVLAGLLERQKQDVLNSYRCRGFGRLTTIELRGWSTLILRRQT